MSEDIARIYAQLPEQDQHALLAFAEFLLAKAPVDQTPKAIEIPEPTQRPENESVVKAIKRLSASYYMVDRDKMLNETSDLMTSHMVSGRAAADVIDDLETLFETHYQHYVSAIESQNNS